MHCAADLLGAEDEEDNGGAYAEAYAEAVHAQVAGAAVDPGFELDELDLDEMDPDDDVGLYEDHWDHDEELGMDEDDDDDSGDDEFLAGDWQAHLGDLIHEDDFHANMRNFQVRTSVLKTCTFWVYSLSCILCPVSCILCPLCPISLM